MDLKAIYETIHGDYEDVISRLRKEDRIQKYLLKFKNQDMVACLKTAIDANDGEKAFLQAHTIKGLCANLSITEMGKTADAITENLREHIITDETRKLYEKLQADSDRVIKAIEEQS